MAKHYVGEVNTDIILNCGTDVSSATTKKIYYLKPTGVFSHWDATVYNTNYLKYTIQDGDIDTGGVWKLQAYVVSPTWTGYGETAEMVVFETFDKVSTELATISDVKQFIGITADTDDVFIYKILKRVSDQIEAECNRHFWSASYTKYYRGDGSSLLQLDEYPVTTLTSIYDDLDRAWGSDTLIASTDLQISDSVKGLIAYEGGTFGKSDDIENLKVTFTAGYTVIPEDLQLATIKRAVADYIESKAGVNVFEGTDFYYKPSKLREEAQIIIDRYKKIR